MEVHLSPDQQAFIRQAIESGRLQREEEAVQQAMALWEERERRRLEILAAVYQAEASVARGEGRVIRSEADLDELVKDVRRRGMEGLASDQGSR